MKKRTSAISLIASGAATIGIGQAMPKYRIMATGEALAFDRMMLKRDAVRAYRAAPDRECA